MITLIENKGKFFVAGYNTQFVSEVDAIYDNGEMLYLEFDGNHRGTMSGELRGNILAKMIEIGFKPTIVN